MNKKHLFIVTILSIVLVSWLWISSDRLNIAPQVSFKTIDGRQFDTFSLRGQPVLVTFWATSCKECVKEMPHLIKLYNELSSDGFELIAVAMAYDPPNQVVDISQRKQIPYPVSLDIDGKIASAFGNISATPTSFLIAPDGKIVKYKIGEMNIEKLRAQIKFLQSDVSEYKAS